MHSFLFWFRFCLCHVFGIFNLLYTRFRSNVLALRGFNSGFNHPFILILWVLSPILYLQFRSVFFFFFFFCFSFFFFIFYFIFFFIYFVFFFFFFFLFFWFFFNFFLDLISLYF